MNAARALKVARHRAGLSQTELARLAGVPPPFVNRIERGKVSPRVDTLERLLACAGSTLAVEDRRGASIDRGPIRELLRRATHHRLGLTQIEDLEELCRRRIRFVVVGDAAARLHGAPVNVSAIEIAAAKDPLNLRKLERTLSGHASSPVVRESGRKDHDLWRDAKELPWLPAPTMRILDRWIDEPTGFLASIDSLLRAASPEMQDLLHAVQDEIDLLMPGERIYRDPERRMLLPPPRPPRYRPRTPRDRRDPR